MKIYKKTYMSFIIPDPDLYQAGNKTLAPIFAP